MLVSLKPVRIRISWHLLSSIQTIAPVKLISIILELEIYDSQKATSTWLRLGWSIACELQTFF